MELPASLDHQLNKMTELTIPPSSGVEAHQLPSVGDVNCHLICTVCQGYLVDATTITECLHSFCRSCVVPHVAEFHQCPSCSVPLSSTKPFSQLRRDYTLQSIVYKMVPRLARNELERRKQFRQERSDHLKMNSVYKTEERYLQSFFAPNDPISMSLEYAEPNCEFGLRAKLAKGTETDDTAGSHQHRRFFRCPADLPISYLIKFLRCKFNVMDPTTHKLEILYNDRPLAPEYKLSDVAYIFSWKEREPLRLWYRISPSIVAVKEEEPIQRKVTTAVDEVKPKGQSNHQRASLVDITSKRSWQCNGKEERKCKRRKRSDKQNEKIQRNNPDTPTTINPIVPSIPAVPKTIFDETRPAEFSCSTPIPSAAGIVVNPSVESASTDSESNKVQNWLPKAVFDLDDRALFAKRLQRITNPSEMILPESKEDPTTPIPTSTIDESIKTEKRQDDIEEMIVIPNVTSPAKETTMDDPESPIGPLNPLRICVTPEPSKAVGDEPEDEIHDSIGALDLSGSKGDSSTDVSSPLSAGSSRSSASPVGASAANATTSTTTTTTSTTPASKVGPHPYFMTPSAVYHHVQQHDPAQSMAALAAAAQQSTPPSNSTKESSPLQIEGGAGGDVGVHTNKSPIWDLFQHIRPSAAHSSQPDHHQSLISLLKSSNPLIFRGGHCKKKKSASRRGNVPSSSPKSA